MQGYAGLQRAHLPEPGSLSMPFRAFLDTMTKWSGAGQFIFQLWPGAPDTPADRGKWKEGAAANGAVLHLLRDLAYPPAVALPLNANNKAAECRAGKGSSVVRLWLRTTWVELCPQWIKTMWRLWAAGLCVAAKEREFVSAWHSLLLWVILTMYTRGR